MKSGQDLEPGNANDTIEKTYDKEQNTRILFYVIDSWFLAFLMTQYTEPQSWCSI